MANEQSAPAVLKGYHPLIAEATGVTDVARLEEIEDCMRNVIFCSTLNWQSREQLMTGAREALEVLEAVEALGEGA